VRGRFLQFRAVAKRDASATFDLQFRHAGGNAGFAGGFIYGNDFLQRWFAFEHRHVLRSQLGFGAQNRLNGKIGNENASKRHKNRPLVVSCWSLVIQNPLRISRIPRIELKTSSCKYPSPLHHPARSASAEKVVFTDCMGLCSSRERMISASICISFKSCACEGFVGG